MDELPETVQKGYLAPRDSTSSSEEANKAPVSTFNLDSTDGIPSINEITRTPSATPGPEIQSQSPITHSSNCPSSESIDGIPREDESSITNSSNGGRDIAGHSPTIHSPNSIRGILMINVGAGKNPTGSKKGNPRFIMDSGASITGTGNRNLFTQLTTDKAGILVGMASGSFLRSHGCGYVITEDYTLANVLYIPGLEVNIVSMFDLTALGYMVLFTSKGCTIMDERTGNIIGKGTGRERLFELDSLRVPLDPIGCFISSEAAN